MGRLICILGKSASGKDTIYRRLLLDTQMRVEPMVTCTTRPMRDGETDGVEYHFCSVEQMKKLEEEGCIIEMRTYDTTEGLWYYFTADDGSVDLEKNDYIIIGTVESYEKLRDYFGKEKVIPIYITLDNGERLSRALMRERVRKNPDYEEMCRRFLADEKDFSDIRLEEAGITKRFYNMNLDNAIAGIKEYLAQTGGDPQSGYQS